MKLRYKVSANDVAPVHLENEDRLANEILKLLRDPDVHEITITKLLTKVNITVYMEEAWHMNK